MIGAMAFALWLLFILAVISGMNGNEGAINGIVGAGIGAVIFTALSVFERGPR